VYRGKQYLTNRSLKLKIVSNKNVLKKIFVEHMYCNLKIKRKFLSIVQIVIDFHNLSIFQVEKVENH